MKIQSKTKRLNKKGFSLVELSVIIAVLAVLVAVLAPALLKYVENSRVQKDESAMDELCGAIKLAMADSQTFDEVCTYAVPENYITYSDSSGVYAAVYTDEEYWAPDGAGHAVTITFNPDENGTYNIADARVNDMTTDNGSVAESRNIDASQQCTLGEMGQQKLYAQLTKTIGTTFTEKSSTYSNSSYTVFIKLNNMNGIKQADVYGSFNGTNLSPDCPAALGSGTEEYTPEGDAVASNPNGGTTTPNFSGSDLSGGGSVSGDASPLPPSETEPEEDVVEESCNLYFGEKYSAFVDGIKVTAIFYEDTSAKMYMNNVLEQEFPAGLIKYDVSTVDLSAINFGVGTISADGKKINVDGATLVLEEGKLHFGVPYTNTDADYAISLVVYEDGRAEIWAYRFWKQDSYPAGTFTYEDNKVITEGIVMAVVSSDGLQVEYEGMTFDLDTSWCPHGDTYKTGETDKYTGDEICVYCGTVVQAGQCRHLHTEIRNAVEITLNTDGYTGDKYCTDCDRCIQRGKAIKKTPLVVSASNRELIGYSDNIKELIIPEVFQAEDGTWYIVTEIATNAFMDCSNLTYVEIPNTVTKINLQAFFGCRNLKKVKIGNGVTTIGNSAFKSCTSLSEIIFEEGSNLKTIGQAAFSGHTNNGSALKHVIIPDGVTSIGAEAFQFQKRMESITIPASVTSIGEDAFALAYWNYESSIQDVYYKGTLEQWCNIKFSYCGNPCNDGANLYIQGQLVENITVPSSVKELKIYAFKGCESLKTITLPEGLTKIGDYAFSGCSSLSNISIPNSITAVGYSAFSGCNALNFNTFGEMQYLGNSTNPYAVVSKALSTSITDGTIHQNTKAFQSQALRGAKIQSAIVPHGVTAIGDSTFYECKSLEYIKIPNTVTLFNKYAFAYCYALKTIEFDGTTSQWNSITKQNLWSAGLSGVEIICSDGTLTI